MGERRVALVPNANNSLAAAIRERTRCTICKEKIETGQEIEISEDGRRQEHVKCLKHDDS